MKRGLFSNCPEFAISLVSVNAMIRLPLIGVPDPNRYSFTPYGVINTAGNKLRVGDGFPSATWQWEDAGLDSFAMGRLQNYLGGLQSAFVYVRTQQNAQYPWANYYGVLSLPALVPAGYNVAAYEPVTWTFNALVQQ